MKNPKHLLIGLVIAILACYFTFRNVSWREFVESFKQINYIYLIPAFVISALSFVARAYRWQVLVEPIKPVEASRLLAPLMIGYMGNMLPARAGEVLRAYLVGKRENVSFSGAFGTVVMERIADLVMLMLLFLWLMLFRHHIFDTGIEWKGISLADIARKFGEFGVIMSLILGALIYMMLHQRKRVVALTHFFLRPFPRKWHDMAEELLEKFSEGLHVMHDGRAVLRLFLWSAVAWVCIIASYAPFYWAYDLNNKSLESMILLLIMVCIFIAAFPTPGMVGSFHAGVLIALHDIMGEPEVVAVSLGMVAWLLNTLVILLGGTYFVLHEHLSVNQLVKVEEEGPSAVENVGEGPSGK